MPLVTEMHFDGTYWLSLSNAKAEFPLRQVPAVIYSFPLRILRGFSNLFGGRACPSAHALQVLGFSSRPNTWAPDKIWGSHPTVTPAHTRIGVGPFPLA